MAVMQDAISQYQMLVPRHETDSRWSMPEGAICDLPRCGALLSQDQHFKIPRPYDTVSFFCSLFHAGEAYDLIMNRPIGPSAHIVTMV